MDVDEGKRSEKEKRGEESDSSVEEGGGDHKEPVRRYELKGVKDKKVREYFENIDNPTGYNPVKYTHVLPPDHPDWSDFSSGDEDEHPELFMTDRDIQDAVNKLSEQDFKRYLELENFCLDHYNVHGYILGPSDWVKMTMYNRYREPPTGTDPNEIMDYRMKLIEEVRRREEKKKQGKVVPVRRFRRIKPEKIPTIDLLGEDEDSRVVTVQIGQGNLMACMDEEEDLLKEVEGLSIEEFEIHADDASGTDLSESCVTLDSVKDLDSAKVGELWRRLAKVRREEAEILDELADQIPYMTPNDVVETARKIPDPQKNAPHSVEYVLREYKTEAVNEIIAGGIILRDQYMEKKNQAKGKPYKRTTFKELTLATKIQSKRLAELKTSQPYKEIKVKKEEPEEEEPESARKRRRKSETPPEPVNQPSTSREASPRE